jgi:hypothetical protein
VFLLREVLGELLELVAHLQCLFHRSRGMHYVRHQFCLGVCAHAALAREYQRDDKHRQ